MEDQLRAKEHKILEFKGLKSEKVQTYTIRIMSFQNMLPGTLRTVGRVSWGKKKQRKKGKQKKWQSLTN